MYLRGLTIGGSTATFAIIQILEDQKPTVARVTVGNIGDSRIILGENYGRSFRALTKDHVPTDVEVRFSFGINLSFSSDLLCRNLAVSKKQVVA